MKYTNYNPGQPFPELYEEGTDAWRKAVAHQRAEAERRARDPSGHFGLVIFLVGLLTFLLPLGIILAWERLEVYDPLGGLGAGAVILVALVGVAYKLPRLTGTILLIWCCLLMVRVLAPFVADGVTVSRWPLGGPVAEGIISVLLAALGIYLIRVGTNRKYG